MPKDLLDSVGSLLDDPLYSDVEFVLPRRGTGLKNAKRIYAAKKLLGRADYFATSIYPQQYLPSLVKTYPIVSVFNSGFAEASHDDTPLTIANIASPSETNDRASEVTAFSGNFEDSDEEDEDILDNASADISQLEFEDRTLLPEDTNNDEEAAPKFPAEPFTSNIDLTDDTDKAEEDEDRRNVRAKLSHPSSPRSHDPPLALTSGYPNTLAGPSKMRVVVKDVAYSTYFAVLHYVQCLQHFPICLVPSLQLLLVVYGYNTIRATVFLFQHDATCHNLNYINSDSKRKSSQFGSYVAHRPIPGRAFNQCRRAITKRMAATMGA